MMVAAHPTDLEAAASHGFRTAYVHRPLEDGPGKEAPWPATGAFDHAAGDFLALADALAGRCPGRELGERVALRYDRTADWPEQEVYPTTPFNYGLVHKPARPEASFTPHPRKGPQADNPFTPHASPLTLTV